MYAASISSTAVFNLAGSTTLQGEGPVLTAGGPTVSTVYRVPVTSAQVKPVIAAPVMGLVPRSPVIVEVAILVIPVSDRMTKLPAFPRTTGAGPAADVTPVVKFHTTGLAKALPAKFLAAVLIVAVNRLLAARLVVGLKIAVVPAWVTVPSTEVAPCFKVKLY